MAKATNQRVKRKGISKSKPASRGKSKSKKSCAAAPPVNPQRIMQMAWGFAAPMIAEAALRNGVFDAMDGGAKTIAQISEKTNTSQRGLSILLDGLVGIGLVHRRGKNSRWPPTPRRFSCIISLILWAGC